VVNFICGREPGDALVIDVAEERAVRLLGRAGLVPQLRHRRRLDAAEPAVPVPGLHEAEVANW
jgi:hypothetical protein